MKGILIISPFFSPNVGGVETHLDDLVNYLKKREYKIFVSTYKPLTTKVKAKYLEKGNNIEIYRFPWFGYNLFNKLEKYPLLDFLYLFPGILISSFMIMVKKSKNIDVIHSHGIVASFVAKIINIFFNKKTVVSFHAIYTFQKNSLFVLMVKFILNNFSKILTISKQSKNQLVDIGISESKIDVYTYWIDQNIFTIKDKTECKNKLKWNDKFVVLFVGRFIKIKGMDVLLDVAKEVNKSISFAFIGDGPMADNIKESSKNKENIMFVGKIDNKDLPIYYNASDLFCIPSQYEEGFGRVILEAVSCGLPVVGTNKGGVPEAVNEEVSILVEPTKDNLKKAIEELYNNKKKLETLKNNCRNYALKHFSELNAKIIEKSYE